MNRNDHNPSLRDDLGLGTAIGLLELCSVARGVEVADAILWESDIELLFATHVQPGKYVILFTGSVEDLRSALRLGAELAQGDLVDQLLIPQVHPQVEAALRRQDGHIEGTIDAVGVVETTTVASAIEAADRSLKRATVDLMELRIANGLGGKSYLSITGEVSDVRSSVAAGAGFAEAQGKLTRQVIIPRPHPDLVRFL
ncbi:MAG: BMC domain-containing protein [Planctomycetota bacterium]|nr:BMC domain-containing protein [Planctomycetota bacterium]